MKETTREREARFRRERFAAIRAATTPEITNEVTEATIAALQNGADLPEWPAGERIVLKAGNRKITIDEGEIKQVALADAVEAAGRRVISYRSRFQIFGGRDTLYYSVGLAREIE